MTSIERDPFSRGDHVRERVDCPVLGGCSWCGKGGRLWRYGWSPDSLLDRTSWLKGQFCCRGCCNSYHDREGT